MKIVEVKSPLPGAAELLEHIRSLGKTIPDFCEETGLDRLKVQKAINGVVLKIDVDFAIDCERATGGAVQAESWCSTEESRAEMKRRRDERTAGEAKAAS